MVKVKAAAQHYETMICCHALTGADIGEFAHGRKQFVDILRCADVWINRETERFLCTPLAATKLPPHFYVTSDKSTPHRTTNQAILLCLMVDGRRQAIAVNAPEVYGEASSGVEGDVSGATAEELAESLHKEIRSAYPGIPIPTINESWMGTVCDGQYQAAGFQSTLAALCEQKDAGTFFSVLWDPPHFLDLAIKSVFDGKTGSSKEFVQRLIERSSVIHRLFQRGKMLSHAKEMAKKDEELVLRLTSRTCSTRFSASQYVEFRKLIESLPLFIKAFREFKYAELKEYQIAGIDFLLDLCSFCDILKPYMELSITLQGLSVPCWKIITLWRRLREYMEEMEEEFSFDMLSQKTPLLMQHAKEVISGSFKNTRLVQGWYAVSSETRQSEDGAETVQNWKARDEDDVEKDVITFMSDIRASLDDRITKSCKELSEVLTCFDLDTLFELFCGERLKAGKLKMKSGEGALEQYGRENFAKFFQYICNLPQVKRLTEEYETEELFFHPSLASAVFHRMKQALKTYLWRDDGSHLATWFGLPSGKTYSGLSKLEIAGDNTEFSLARSFLVTVKNMRKSLKAHLNEGEVYHTIFTDEALFGAIGIEGCICLDIALAKGGTEAIVESFYSVMTSHKKAGGQANDTLGLR